MKINYIVNARIPTEKAHGYQITKMCEEFAYAGVKVELCVPARANPIKEDLFAYYNFKKNFTIKRINSYDFFKHIDFLGGRLSYYLQSIFFFIAVLFLSLDKKTLIYTRNPAIAWLGYLKRKKVAYECHDWFGGKVGIYLFFLRHVDYLITTNRYIKEEFIKRGFRQENILVAPNGINLQIFNLSLSKENAISKLRTATNRKQELIKKNILLYTGSFRTMGVEKGIAEILQAVKILANNDLFFVAIGGSDEDIDYYREKARNLDVSKQVLFLPRFPQKELATWQRAADILLMPFPDKAHYRYHMTPLKMFEYMAAGRPIIASDLPSIKEVLNKNNAIFVKAGDINDLAEKIKQIIDHKINTKCLIKQALKDVKQYTWQKRSGKILNFIQYGK